MLVMLVSLLNPASQGGIYCTFYGCKCCPTGIVQRKREGAVSKKRGLNEALSSPLKSHFLSG